MEPSLQLLYQSKRDDYWKDHRREKLDLKGYDELYSRSIGKKRMNQLQSAKVFFLSFLFFLSLFMAACSTTKEEEMMPMHEAMPMQEGMAMMRTYPKDYVFPLSEINLEKVIEENSGLKVLRENATTVSDYYRGGVQEKAEGERLLREEKWEEAMSHFIKSNRFLEVVVDYLPEDEPYRNIYGDHYIIFIPNLLIADNYLKLVRIYQKLEMSRDDIYWEKKSAKKYLAHSLRSVQTEWALQVKRELEEE
jgi:hypothetical protein